MPHQKEERERERELLTITTGKKLKMNNFLLNKLINLLLVLLSLCEMDKMATGHSPNVDTLLNVIFFISILNLNGPTFHNDDGALI